MRQLLLLGSVFSLLFALSSCKDEFSIDNGDALLFGHFYGQCVGEQCVETYLLTADALFEDTNDNYGGQNFNFVPRSDEDFQQVRDLIDLFPTELLAEEETTLGCPDCADGGGIHLQINDGTTERIWRIDQDKDNVPAYLHNFIDAVNERIARISD